MTTVNGETRLREVGEKIKLKVPSVKSGGLKLLKEVSIRIVESLVNKI